MACDSVDFIAMMVAGRYQVGLIEQDFDKPDEDSCCVNVFYTIENYEAIL